MSRFTVVWEPSAQDTLAEVWMRSAARNAVSAAADQIDERLREAPATNGQEMSEGLWKLSEPPLVAFYEIAIVDLMVRVVHVRLED